MNIEHTFTAERFTSLVETITAISAEFHASPAYRKFYDVHGESLAGFPGIWHYVGCAAVIFDTVEGMRPDRKFEFIDAIDQFSRALVTSDDLLTDEEIANLANAAMEACC